MRVKGQKKTFHVNRNSKKAEVTILLEKKTEPKTKLIRDKGIG